jgi:hypothetical protein
VREHPDRFSRTAQRLARTGRSTTPQARDVLYDPLARHYFVQFLGPSEDLLWFGDLIRDRLLMQLETQMGPDTLRRRARARTLGAKGGFAARRPGLLTPAGRFGWWLSRLQRRPEELLFEPEALYVGTLFGAALATLALSNGARASELLQVSADRFVTRVYEPQHDGRPTGERRVIVLQHLLAKGGRTEAERQLFPISPWALELLTEIGGRLRAAHGGAIPRVAPKGSLKDCLQPERYLFQWGASADGRKGVIDLDDLSVLLRFVLHGLELRTARVSRSSSPPTCCATSPPLPRAVTTACRPRRSPPCCTTASMAGRPRAPHVPRAQQAEAGRQRRRASAQRPT